VTNYSRLSKIVIDVPPADHAERVQQVHGWRVMRDPAGLPFCVIPEADDVLTDDNARRWD